MPCEKEGEEENFVAKANNWAQRITAEMDAARIWVQQWGKLLGEDEGKPKTIEVLQEELSKIKQNGVNRMTTVFQASYKNVKPYREWNDYRRKNQFTNNIDLDEE